MKEKNCGIYAIINIINQKLYIGSSKDLKYRKRKHFEGLRYNRHPNNYLQQSFNKYGEKSFDFKVIEYCKESKLLEREQYYINYYQSCNRNCGFNLSLKAGRIVLTEEGREKMRQSHLGKKQSLGTIEKRALKLRGKKRSKEVIEKIKRTKQANAVNKVWLGRKHKPETIEKIRQSSLGRKFTDEHKEKLSKAKLGRKIPREQVEKLRQFLLGRVSPMKGRHHTEETKLKFKNRKLSSEHKEKLRQAGLGRKMSKESKEKMKQSKRKYIFFTEEWRKLKNQGLTYKEISEKYNIRPGVICNYLKNLYPEIIR